MKDNDNLLNIYWGTRKNNVADMIRVGAMRGTFPNGHNAKLTNDQVRFIRQNARIISERKLAKICGVGRGAVTQVLEGKSFKYVQ